MTAKNTQFSTYDPEWCAFFTEAIRRTVEDRQTDSRDAELLTSALRVLPEARVRSGHKQGRSVVFEFETKNVANQARSMLLLGGPNFKRRMCVIDVAADGTPLSVEIAP
jgi:hypothetical protein